MYGNSTEYSHNVETLFSVQRAKVCVCKTNHTCSHKFMMNILLFLLSRNKHGRARVKGLYAWEQLTDLSTQVYNPQSPNPNLYTSLIHEPKHHCTALPPVKKTDLSVRELRLPILLRAENPADHRSRAPLRCSVFSRSAKVTGRAIVVPLLLLCRALPHAPLRVEDDRRSTETSRGRDRRGVEGVDALVTPWWRQATQRSSRDYSLWPIGFIP